MNLVHHLQDIVERHINMFEKKKLKQYVTSLTKVETYVRTKLKNKTFVQNISEIIVPQEEEF